MRAKLHENKTLAKISEFTVYSLVLVLLNSDINLDEKEQLNGKERSWVELDQEQVFL